MTLCVLTHLKMLDGCGLIEGDSFAGILKNPKDGDGLIILLGGGSKKEQDKDIDAAKKYWA